MTAHFLAFNFIWPLRCHLSSAFKTSSFSLATKNLLQEFNRQKLGLFELIIFMHAAGNSRKDDVAGLFPSQSIAITSPIVLGIIALSHDRGRLNHSCEWASHPNKRRFVAELYVHQSKGHHSFTSFPLNSTSLVSSSQAVIRSSSYASLRQIPHPRPCC